MKPDDRFVFLRRCYDKENSIGIIYDREEGCYYEIYTNYEDIENFSYILNMLKKEDDFNAREEVGKLCIAKDVRCIFLEPEKTVGAYYDYYKPYNGRYMV